ncbi:MAG TPA: hypothetical protein VF130_00125, partial [Candidatus Binatia bacterium]
MTSRENFYRHLLMLAAGFGAWSAIGFGYAQEKSAAPGQAEMSLRKSVDTREFQGQQVEGEERQIGRGDSLWRILVEEKGLPGQKFRSYLVVIRGLNPQAKNLDVLRVGDKIFIPLRVDGAVETAREPNQLKPGTTINYRVKSGEHLYQILRDQLKVTDERKVAQYYSLAKDLNPERKDWDTLLEGETIRLPTVGTGLQSASAESAKSASDKQTPVSSAGTARKPPIEVKNTSPLDTRQALGAKENMVLFASVVEALGNEIQQSGEEIVALGEENIRFERSAYPVVYNPTLRQKLVIDPEGKIPASLKSRLNDPRIGAQVLPNANGLSIQEAVGQLLDGLGYQSLPTDRPIMIQEEGVAFEAKGNWMALAPTVSNKPQEVLVINLTERPNETPEYLKAELAKKGLQLREVVLPTAAKAATATMANEQPKTSPSQVKNWPRDKQEIVDALLLSYGVTFGTAESLSIKLSDGLRVDTRTDRVFETAGQRTALFFRAMDPDIRKSLQEQQGIKTIELDLRSLSSRELIARVLPLLGDQAAYLEHRFPAAPDSARDQVTVKVWGFQLTKKPIFLTDRQIPPP